jgi:Protein of unknown function (DUF2934)
MDNDEQELNRHELIARRAYQRWQARGCPVGSPETDWFQAEEEITQDSEAAWEITPEGTVQSASTTEAQEHEVLRGLQRNKQTRDSGKVIPKKLFHQE